MLANNSENDILTFNLYFSIDIFITHNVHSAEDWRWNAIWLTIW